MLSAMGAAARVFAHLLLRPYFLPRMPWASPRHASILRLLQNFDGLRYYTNAVLVTTNNFMLVPSSASKRAWSHKNFRPRMLCTPADRIPIYSRETRNGIRA